MSARRLIAMSLSAGLILVALTAEAKPSSTTTASASWSRSLPGYSEEGSVFITEGPSGSWTLYVDITRTRSCAGGVPGQTAEVWHGSTSLATLAVPHNLATAYGDGTVPTGYSLTSSCLGELPVTGPVGTVIIDGVANSRTVRERTIDGIRILRRTADFVVTYGDTALFADGWVEKQIG